jgi:hypothetical protein
MTALSYIVKSGACSLAEMSALMRTDKASADTLKKWAVEEMNALGVPLDAPTGVVKEA